ncbi:hypothetical protein EAE96_004350 [Botrytis aclada]|nr:hypothetical protein EAE96_004350 [Botrytis aclada]
MRVVQILSLVAQYVMVVRGASSICQTQVDPRSIDTATRSQWCTVQTDTCETLCSGVTDENTCDITSLCYSCTCTSNSLSPALQLYTSTIPFFVCEQVFADCILAVENDPAAQKACHDTEVQNCGTINSDTVSSSAFTLPSKSTGIPAPIPQFTSQTGTNTEELVTSTTETVTPTPTGTTTVWTTSTASSGSGSVGNGTTESGSVSGSATGSLSSLSLSGVTVGSSNGGSGSTAASTVPRTSSSKTAIATAIGTSAPSTISEGGAERMRIGGAWVAWGVLMLMAGGGLRAMDL